MQAATSESSGDVLIVSDVSERKNLILLRTMKLLKVIILYNKATTEYKVLVSISAVCTPGFKLYLQSRATRLFFNFVTIICP
jgi:hypothetical protein